MQRFRFISIVMLANVVIAIALLEPLSMASGTEVGATLTSTAGIQIFPGTTLDTVLNNWVDNNIGLFYFNAGKLYHLSGTTNTLAGSDLMPGLISTVTTR